MSKLTLAKRAIAGAVLFGVAAITPAQALDPGDSIYARKAMMWSMGAHMGGIKAGMAAKNGKLIAGHARAIAALSPAFAKMFPKGTETGNTRAKPEIWSQMDKFQAAAKVLQTEASALAQVAGTGDMAKIGAQFGKMAKLGCGGCHKPFRGPKKK